MAALSDRFNRSRRRTHPTSHVDRAEDQAIPVIQIEQPADARELLDAGEQLEAIIERLADDPCPALLHLLLALDEAITGALNDASPGSTSDRDAHPLREAYRRERARHRSSTPNAA